MGKTYAIADHTAQRGPLQPLVIRNGGIFIRADRIILSAGDAPDDDSPAEQYSAAWNSAEGDLPLREHDDGCITATKLNVAEMTAPERFGDWMQTYRGAPFWPMDPRPDEIHILDIAHSLSMLCRYNGHCVRFYSVAEHSVHVSRAVPQEHALWGLLHDAGEAYLADVPRPVKPSLPGYKEAEGRLQLAIAERFGLPAAIPPEVHDADNRILVDEKEQAMLPSQREWSIPPFGIGARISFWDPGRAEQEFMRRYHELTRVPECLMAGAA